MAAVPSEELRTVLLLTANFKFRNRSTCSKGPMKRAGKVCGDSQDLKSPDMVVKFYNYTNTMRTYMDTMRTANDTPRIPVHAA